MALAAVIFDLDGTLVDTNALHIEAWRRAFASLGYTVAPDRIDIEVGKGGDNLVPSILGNSLAQRDGQRLRAAQPKEFERLVSDRGIALFPRSTNLVQAVRDRGIQAALASSSGQSHLEIIERATGIDLQRMFDVIVSGDDIDRSKPAADLVLTACRKLGLSPAQCAMVGDTAFDARACLRAGVVCIGLSRGGPREPAELLRSGARVVFGDPADLLSHLDQALQIASPAPIQLTHERIESLMREALVMAESAIDHGEAPIGCVLATGDGTIIARAHNQQNHTQSKAAHAEMVAFAQAAGKVPLDRRDLIMVSTLEPCVMCTGAAMIGAVDTILYGLRAPADAGTARVRPPQSPESQMPRIIGDILPEQSLRLFERWLEWHADDEQAKYVKQLLSLHGHPPQP